MSRIKAKADISAMKPFKKRFKIFRPLDIFKGRPNVFLLGIAYYPLKIFQTALRYRRRLEPVRRVNNEGFNTVKRTAVNCGMNEHKCLSRIFITPKPVHHTVSERTVHIFDPKTVFSYNINLAAELSGSFEIHHYAVKAGFSYQP